MRAALNDLPSVHDEDEVRVANRGKAMRYRESRAIRHEFLERVLDEPFGDGVECARSLVEDENRRVLEYRARNCDSLALAAGKRETLFADNAVVSVGLGNYEVMGVCELGGRNDLLVGCIERAIADVVLDRVVEEERFLH